MMHLLPNDLMRMTKEELKKKSKFLSFVLRHKPQKIGLSMDEQGWVEVRHLLERAKAHKEFFDAAILAEVVQTNDKQRFSFSEDGVFIRANQGHSIGIDLALEAIKPPEFLYHGTATRFVEAIRENGLKKMKRQHVHLSQELETAQTVGARHGKPFIFVINAREMHKAGHEFYCSENGVWLTDKVPASYLQEEDRDWN